jgi:anti-sigma B factor antagonist
MTDRHLPTEPFDVDVQARDGELWVLPTGDLDILSAPELDEALALALRSDADTVVIDLRGLGLLDSTGLRVLVKACFGDDGHRVSLVRGSEHVSTVLRISGLEERLPFRPADA